MSATPLQLKNERVLVTGGAGFLGSFVVENLKKRGLVESNLFIPRSREYDLRQSEAITRLFDLFKPTVVIHLAANCGGIGANQDDPGRFFYDNAIMGIQLIEQSRLKGVKKFVQVGTVCAYPAFPPRIPFKEEDLWEGYPEPTNAPYGLAKRMLLVQGQAYRLQYQFDVIYLLPANLYGPRDNFDLHTSHVIPAMIRKFLEAKERGDSQVTLWGSGKPTREFLYAGDAAEGIVLAAEKYSSKEPCNLGTGEEVSISDLANAIKKITGYRGQIVWDAKRPDGQLRRMLDVSRATKEIGFTAKTPLLEGLKNTMAWYMESHAAQARS